MEEFIPTTFRMDVKEEREDFFSHFAQQEGKTGKDILSTSAWLPVSTATLHRLNWICTIFSGFILKRLTAYEAVNEKKVVLDGVSSTVA